MCEGLREVGQSKLWPESAKEGPRGTSFPEGTPSLAGHRHSSAASKEQGARSKEQGARSKEQGGV